MNKCPCDKCICLSICRWKTPAHIIDDCCLVLDYIKAVEEPERKLRISKVADIMFGGVNGK